MTSNARTEIISKLLEARRTLARQRSEFEAMSEDQLVALHERLEQAVDDLGDLIPRATPPGRLEEFFDQVGQGMITAQTRLDQESAAYNQQRGGASLPTAFRIPKVSAETGFTMARNRQSGFRVFALGRSGGQEQRHSNKVTFDIVAAPPPAIETLPAPAQFIVDREDRLSIGVALAQSKKVGTVATEAAEVLRRSFDNALVLQSGSLVFLALAGKGAALLFGTLDLEQKTFKSAGPLPKGQREQPRWQLLSKLLVQIQSAQAELQT